MKDFSEPDVVIYHGNCSDGYASKFICQKKWGNTPAYIAKGHSKNLDVKDIDFEYKGKNILFVDFIYDNKDIMEEINNNAKNLLIIDHHLTGMEKYKNSQFKDKMIYDVNKSACVLLWETLYPNQKIPLILKYVEDRDLRRWKMPHVNEVLSVLDTLPKEREQWNIFNSNLENNLTEIVQKGILIKHVFNGYLQTILMQKKEIEIQGYTGAVVNTSWEFTSYAADALAEKYDFGMAWFLDSKNMVKCSLRSKKGLSVKNIAELFGGGGHFDNAGCTISLSELEHILNNNYHLVHVKIDEKKIHEPIILKRKMG